MGRQTKIFSAVVAVVSLAFPLAGCQSNEEVKPPETAESAAVEVEVVEEETEEAGPTEGEAGEVAQWYIDATKGAPEAWDDYGVDVEPRNAVEEELEANVAALEMLGDEPLTDAQIAEVEEAIAEAYTRVEVTLEDEDVKDDEATVTFAIKGINYSEGSELAATEPEAQEIVKDPDATMDDLYFYIAVNQWKLAPLTEEPLKLEMKLYFDDEDEKWGPDPMEAVYLNGALAAAYKGETESFERMLEYLDE